MGTSTSNQSVVALPINNVLQRGLLSAAKRRFPYYYGTMPGMLERRAGTMTVKWRRIENVAVSATPAALGEVDTSQFGMGRTPITPTITDLTVAVAKYGDAFDITEEVDLFQVNSGTIQLINALGEQAGAKANVLQRNVYNALSTTRFGAGAASASACASPLTLNDVRYISEYLSGQSAMKFFATGTGSRNIGTSPIRDAYYGVCHTDNSEDIRAISGFVPSENYAGYTEVLPGEIGLTGAIRWLETETAPVESGVGTDTSTTKGGASATDLYSLFVYGREAAGTIGLGAQWTDDVWMGEHGPPPSPIEIIQHPPGSSGVADRFNEMGSIANKFWWAGKVLNTNWILKVRVAATLWSG